MITINGSAFARNKAEAAKSLFSSGGTVTGFYKPVKGGRGLILMDMQRVPKVAAYVSREGSALVNCGRDSKGEMFYQYGLGLSQALWLGSADLEASARANSEAAEDLLSQAGL